MTAPTKIRFPGKLDGIRAKLAMRMEARLPGHVGPYVRTGPVTSNWGYGRGTPIDRWYIERFLDRHRGDIRGRVLEVGGDDYVRRFGSAIEQVDIIDINSSNARATIVTDLEAPDIVPDATFDCFVMTQVLYRIFDVRAALRQCARILKPGGVLLLTVPGIAMVVDPLDYWHFTRLGLARAMSEAFGPGATEVEGHGNSCLTTAFLTGLAAEEFDTSELLANDARFPLVLTCRALRV